MTTEPRDGPHGDSTDRFNALWDAHCGRVLAYATRHVGPDAAQEVTAETFLVAWRRLADVPGHALPWLLVVARNTIANHRRSSHRREVLHQELARLQRAAAPAAAADVTAEDRAQVLQVLAGMSATEREALLLVTWDGLAVPEAAAVAGCSTSAMHVRLFRARRRLRRGTATEDAEDRTGSTDRGAPPAPRRPTTAAPAPARAVPATPRSVR